MRMGNLAADSLFRYCKKSSLLRYKAAGGVSDGFVGKGNPAYGKI